ncbi:MAG: hypothetical protein GKR87_01465 [Kiritimatiellae bacterium]|nr:hypothetical protein [Kiritimatiellia bacterium]
MPPGLLRRQDEHVTFGAPRHRGATGGEEYKTAFSRFCATFDGEMRGHDPLVRVLAAHYHFAAMHPFLDGKAVRPGRWKHSSFSAAALERPSSSRCRTTTMKRRTHIYRPWQTSGPVTMT